MCACGAKIAPEATAAPNHLLGLCQCLLQSLGALHRRCCAADRPHERCAIFHYRVEMIRHCAAMLVGPSTEEAPPGSRDNGSLGCGAGSRSPCDGRYAMRHARSSIFKYLQRYEPSQAEGVFDRSPTNSWESQFQSAVETGPIASVK